MKPHLRLELAEPVGEFSLFILWRDGKWEGRTLTGEEQRARWEAFDTIQQMTPEVRGQIAKVFFSTDTSKEDIPFKS